MSYWLMKSEPDEFSIDDLRASPNKTTAWFGVRNYQARNFMRAMMLGDHAFFYHSSCATPGIAGVVTVSRLAYPDQTQFDAQSKYYEPKATRETPRWYNVDVTFVRKTRLVSLQELRSYPQLGQMRVLRPGNRLSITPVEPNEWDFILRISKECGVRSERA
jgi:predicted RNA-binding protein with PUA-like domain